MRYPSITTIQNGLSLARADAVKVRKLMDGRLNPLDVPETAAWARQCYHMPRLGELKMHAIDTVIGGHGVEGIEDSSGSLRFTYCNMGDTYTATIVRCGSARMRYSVTSWGDVVETLERRGVSFA